MDIGKAFGFVFQDERWVTKVLIGGLLIWIPVVNFAVFGYMLKTAENVARGNPQPLPEWGDFGDLFIRGLYYVIIAIVYAIPVIVLGCIYGLTVGGLSAAADRSGDAAAGGAAALTCILYPLLLILGLLTALVLYPATARYVATNNLSEAFKFGEVFASLRSNIGPWIILILVGILAGIVGQLGLIACGIGVLFTGFYSYLVQGHALGQTIQQTGLVGNGVSIPPTVPPYEPPSTTYQ